MYENNWKNIEEYISKAIENGSQLRLQFVFARNISIKHITPNSYDHESDPSMNISISDVHTSPETIEYREKCEKIGTMNM